MRERNKREKIKIEQRDSNKIDLRKEARGGDLRKKGKK